MTFIDGMKAGRPIQMSAAIRWWAVGCLFLWLGAASASASQSVNCNSPLATDSCATIESGCCCENEKSFPVEPGTALPPATTQYFLRPLPAFNETKLCDDVPEVAGKELWDDRHEVVIPAELRLGSALWSHAPPTCAA